MNVSTQSLKSYARRYRRNRMGVFGLVVILTIVIVSFFPYIMPWYFHEPWAISTDVLVNPNQNHPMGTDELGRDVFSRFMYGVQVTLYIGLVGASISTLMGIFIGSISGYFGGSIDVLLMRLADLSLVMPTFFVALVVVALLGSSHNNIILIIGLLYWPSTAKVVRSEMLSLREREFVSAAKIMGMSDLRIVFSELLPNAIYGAITNGTLQIASAILLESGISFLGFGDPNYPTWGSLLSQARLFLQEAWWMALFPGLGILITTFSISLVGDALNEAANPRLWTSKG